jgi:hypothetical protein
MGQQQIKGMMGWEDLLLSLRSCIELSKGEVPGRRYGVEEDVVENERKRIVECWSFSVDGGEEAHLEELKDLKRSEMGRRRRKYEVLTLLPDDGRRVVK